MNLVINACESIPEDGAIDIVADAPDGKLRISVTDTGVGMSPDVIQKAFDPFFTTKGYGGTGLGLSLVQGIITRHDGTVEIDSRQGKGTTIRIILPVAASVEDPEETGPAAAAEPLKCANILVIKDDPLVREIMADILSLDGHSVTLAESGEQGLALFDASDYDMVFTDLGMPGLTGWEVAHAVKRRRNDVPVIMLTGWGAAIEQAETDRNGVDEVLAKPPEIDELLKTVRRFIEEPA